MTLKLFSCVTYGMTHRGCVMELGSSDSQRFVISVLIISFAQCKSNHGKSQRSPAEREAIQLIKNKWRQLLNDAPSQYCLCLIRIWANPFLWTPLNSNLRRCNSIWKGPASRQGGRPTRDAHTAVGTAVYNDHHTDYPTLQTLWIWQNRHLSTRSTGRPQNAARSRIFLTAKSTANILTFRNWVPTTKHTYFSWYTFRSTQL